VVDTVAALAEMMRVTRPGGRLVVTEFSQPHDPTFRRIYSTYLMRALPSVARAVARDPDAYVYLAESISQWPDQEALAGLVADAGWHEVSYRNLSGGIVAMHRATRPV
jgi:demethylmenaquinone methyltransferase / 2-methoxy-6-polyprenyl-1,4-benzoquinol methylase